MSKNNRQPIYLAALDIGSTKVVFSIAQAKSDGIEVIGVGVVPHLGVKQGAVVNIESTTEAIVKAKEEACLLYTSPSPRDRTRSRMPSSA